MNTKQYVQYVYLPSNPNDGQSHVHDAKLRKNNNLDSRMTCHMSNSQAVIETKIQKNQDPSFGTERSIWTTSTSKWAACVCVFGERVHMRDLVLIARSLHFQVVQLINERKGYDLLKRNIRMRTSSHPQVFG